jgi:NAD-dependent dihydropyrimidine dehydrogenase PreA subunit
MGVHGTFVAVDWDSCVADGICLLSCPVKVFEWYKNPGETGRNDRKDYTDKANPVKEADCIWCMACVEVCPTKAIKVDQLNQDIHEKEIAKFA